MITNFMIGVIIVAVVGFALYGARRKRMMDAAGRVLVEVNAIWAVQGPYKNGEESARAMRIATIAVRGAEAANAPSTAGALAGHAASYNSKIKAWESLRQDYLGHARGKKFEENLAKAVALGAVVKVKTTHQKSQKNT